MDDLLATLGVLVMIEQLSVVWLLAIYEAPTIAAFYAAELSSPTIVWYVHSSCSSMAIYPFFLSFRLARGSILASVIHIIPGGSLRVGALCVSGLFVIFYVVIIAQFIWVCQTDLEADDTGYVPSLDPLPR